MSRESSILAPLQNQLVLSLGSARAFRIAPPISDRQVWQRLGDTGVSIVASAEDFLAHPIPALSLGDYLDNAEAWHEARTQRRRRLRVLTLAAAYDGTDRYVRPLAETVWAVCEEATWLSPATARLDSDPLPDVERPRIDPLSAETAMDLSVMCQIAGNALAAFSQRLIDLIFRSLEDRILRPFQEREDAAVDPVACLPGCMAAFLTFVTDDKRRWACMRKAWRQLEDALAALRDDGTIEGGLEEWLDYAEHLGDCMEMIRTATEGEIDLARLDAPSRLFRACVKRFLTGGFFLNPGERSPQPHLDGVRVYRLGDFADDDAVRDMGVHLTRLYGVQGKDSDLWHESYRIIRAADILADRAKPPRLLQCYLPDAQMLVARSRANTDNGFLLAAWGGHNGEKNTHLDVGCVTLFANGEPVLCDMGTFADTDLHSLPVIGGFTQQFGRQYRAQDAACRLNEDYALITLDLSTAYPASAAVYGWQRTAVLVRDENAVQLIDAFDLTRRQSVRFCFITPFQPVLTPKHVQIGSVRLRWDPDLNPSVEEIPVRDDSLRDIWGSSLYRLCFDTPEPVDNGKYTFTVNLLRTYGSLN